MAGEAGLAGEWPKRGVLGLFAVPEPSPKETITPMKRLSELRHPARSLAAPLHSGTARAGGRIVTKLVGGRVARVG